MSAGSIRQGDILLVPVNVELSPRAERVKSLVLAEGEITGHNHTLTAEAGIIHWQDFVVVQGDAPGILQHPDHDPHPAPVVPPGVVFRVVHQREYTLAEQWQPIRD